MFTWLMDWVREQKIALDFINTEKALRLAHQQEARARFCTIALERQAADLQALIEAAAQQRFGQASLIQQRVIASLQQELATYQARQALLARDFKSELAGLYETLHANKATLQALYVDKDSAYDDLNDARESLDGWYGKAERTPWLFGNGSRALPRHSLFGQDLADRDRYKEERDEAYGAIEECREEIQALKKRNQALFKRIQVVKADRQRMFDLRQSGQNRHLVEQKLHDLRQSLQTALHQQQDLDTQRLAFVAQEQASRGVKSLQERIAVLTREGAAFLQAFEAPAAVAARQQQHREAWLQRQV